MAHKFDRSQIDPYAEAAHQVEENMIRGTFTFGADAESQVFDALSNAVVTAVGDVAAAAFRLGINDPSQLRGLAVAIGRTAEKIVSAYQGEIDPSPALGVLESDPRLSDLPDVQQERLRREVAKTRELEMLVLDTRRLPDLLDLAGQIGLRVPDNVMDSGEVVMTTHPTPTQPSSDSLQDTDS